MEPIGSPRFENPRPPFEEPRRGRSGWLLSLLFDTRVPMPRYVLRAAALSVLPSILIAGLLTGLGVLTPESAPSFGELERRPGLFVLLAVVVGPLAETLMMSALFGLMSLLTRQRLVLAGLSTLIWASMHSAVAPGWGLTIAWPFFVFSCVYLAWRERSWWRAILATWAVHGLQNLLPSLGIFFAG